MKKDIQVVNSSEYFKNIPTHVRMVVALIQHNEFEAYLVGGCVRDHFMGNVPNDYDIATNATPEQIIELFPRTFYENVYGTVGVVTISEQDEEKMRLVGEINIEKLLKESIVEVTPYRLESEYTDGRRPDSVKWSQNIHDDLKRRDFTCNALAYDIVKDIMIDDFEGIKDIKNKTLRAVGNPEQRFREDALRLIRGVRFAGQLGFQIEDITRETLKANVKLLKNISHERIRDEFCKILMTSQPKQTIELAHELGILEYISPEIEKGIGVNQNQAHSFDVWEHNLRTCQHAADKGWTLELRLSALFHDVSKPETRRYSKEKKDYTFYGHDVVGGRVSREIMERLKFPRETIEYVSSMVRWHMFFSDTEQITLSAVRRLISNVGKDKIWDLVNLRICDRVGTGRPKEEPYRFRKYQSMIQQALVDPVSLKQMKINGERIMNVTQETPGPRVGMILNALFGEVLDDPSKNTVEYLESRALHMKTLTLAELAMLAKQGVSNIQKENADQLIGIRKEFRVS